MQLALRSLLLALGGFLPVAAFAQGSLTPPGAPAPSMRSLTELDASLSTLDAKAEPRIAVDTLPGDATALRIISAPGSYYLRGNLTSPSDTVSAIRVASDGVVLDLNGFTLTGSGATSNVAGIKANAGAYKRLVIHNGTITGWYTGTEGGTGAIIHDLVVDTCRRNGVEGGSDSIVHHVVVRNAGYIGIVGDLIEHCRVNVVGGFGANAYGIAGNIVRHCEASNVTASGTAFAFGIQARTVSHCTVYNITAAASCSGIDVSSGTEGNVDHCQVEGVSSTGASGTATTYGINAYRTTTCSVNNVLGSPSVAYGISGTCVQDCIASNVSSSASTGFVVAISANLVGTCRVYTVGGAGTTTIGIAGTNLVENHVTGVSPTAGSGTGLRVEIGGIARGNVVSFARTYGIDLISGGALAEGNVIRAVGTDAAVTTGAGIVTSSGSNRIERNSVVGGSGCDYGIRVLGTLNFVAGNRCTGAFTGAATGAGGVDTPEFNLAAGNRFGTVVSVFAATGEITATNPFSNFSD